MTIITDLTTAPKALQALVVDAKEAGYSTVEARTWSGPNAIYWDVTISGAPYGQAEMFVQWMTKNVAGMNSRLGFATSYKAGMRFDYANGRTATGAYVSPKSVRQARFALGIPTT